MVSNTTRMGLIKPAGGESVDVAQLNTNSDYLDKFASCIMVNDGVTPANSDLFDGAVVKERTSGISWVAQKNVGGTFDKVYLTYPYLYSAYTAASGFNSSGSFQDWGWSTIDTAKCVNASALQQVAGTNFWKAPVKGIYSIDAHAQWGANVSGRRYGLFTVNGTLDVTNSQVGTAAISGAVTDMTLRMTRLLAVNDVIGTQLLQDSGSTLTLVNVIFATLVNPVQ